MKQRLLYQSPQIEVFKVALEGSCLHVNSMTTTNPDNPMPWDDDEE